MFNCLILDLLFGFIIVLVISSPKVCCLVAPRPLNSFDPLHLSSCRYPKDTKPKFNNLKSKKASSFHEFARSTNDAWDIDDEEDEDFLGTPAPASGLHSTSTQNQVLLLLQVLLIGSEVEGEVLMSFLLSSHRQQQQENEAGDTEGRTSHTLAHPDAHNLQDVQEEDADCEHINGKVVKSNSEAHLNSSSGTAALRSTEQLIR